MNAIWTSKKTNKSSKFDHFWDLVLKHNFSSKLYLELILCHDQFFWSSHGTSSIDLKNEWSHIFQKSICSLKKTQTSSVSKFSTSSSRLRYYSLSLAKKLYESLSMYKLTARKHQNTSETIPECNLNVQTKKRSLKFEDFWRFFRCSDCIQVWSQRCSDASWMFIYRYLMTRRAFSLSSKSNTGAGWS